MGDKRQATGQALVKDDTHGPDVGATIEAMGLAWHLLGCHVCSVSRRPRRPDRICKSVGNGQAEIGHTGGLTLLIDHDVGPALDHDGQVRPKWPCGARHQQSPAISSTSGTPPRRVPLLKHVGESLPFDELEDYKDRAIFMRPTS